VEIAQYRTPFEIACWAVITQRTPIPVARRFKQTLVERYGTRITLDGVTNWTFPEPAVLVTVDPADLAALLHNERKAEYLAAVIAFFNQTDERYLRTGPYDEVAERIRAIRGIGAWSAKFILVRGLGRMECVDAGDRELLGAATRVYGNSTTITPAVLQAIIDRYGAAQGYWAYYLRNAMLPMAGSSTVPM
jgi:DNA-3-methyladenine glycosylase II